MNIPKNIEKYRKILGLKQKDLAKLIGVTPSAISQFESGTITPSRETLIQLTIALSCSLEQLIY